jgi:hypothetical protein
MKFKNIDIFIREYHISLINLKNKYGETIFYFIPSCPFFEDYIILFAIKTSLESYPIKSHYSIKSL